METDSVRPPEDAAGNSAKHNIIVLLVDDQWIIGEAVKRMLEHEKDISFHYCQDPSKAVESANGIGPTVILQDLVMPDVDGLTLVKLYKANEKTKDIPVIVLSSEEDATVKSKAFALHANDYLIKLPDRIELLARIRHHSQGYINMLERNEAFDSLLKSQRALALAHRLEAIGQLSAGVAHEINTPIQYIGDNLSFLKDSFQAAAQHLSRVSSIEAPDDLAAKIKASAEEADLEFLLDEIPKALQQSIEGIARIAEIVHAIKEFAHPEVKEKMLVDINKAILNTITVARNEWKYVAEVETDLAQPLPQTLCNPGEMNQLILNLLINAAQAIEERYGRSTGSKGHILISSKALQDGVEIRVKDDGPGIPENIRDRVFTPFFTTKEVGKGTGQGLSLCRSIAQKHNGEISFESEPGAGACFIVRIPFKQDSP